MILDGSVVHGCPASESGVTSCCRRLVLELPRSDRLTNEPNWVTCPGRRPLVGLFDMPDGSVMPAREAIGVALGAASMCWEHVERAGVFDSSRCGEVLDLLLAHLEGLPAAGGRLGG